jgi:hypothetical protein
MLMKNDIIFIYLIKKKKKKKQLSLNSLKNLLEPSIIFQM